MSNYFNDNEDLRWYVDRGIEWAPLIEATEYGFRAPDAMKNVPEAVAFYREVLESVGELAAKYVGERSAAMDREHPHVSDGEVIEGAAVRKAFDAFRENELHRMVFPRELGGLNVPLIVYYLAGELIARGDVGAMTHFSFHAGIGMAMLAYSIYEGSTHFDVEAGKIASTRFQKEIEEIVRGEAWGCMVITEPDAGSDMARLRTKATLGDDGVWRLSGQKIFITSGHAKYHLVIARTEESSGQGMGLDGLSMFMVQAYEDLPDGKRKRFVTIDRVEDKLGHNSSVTAALTYEDTPAQLVGARGEGFKYMLVLMNNARVGVSFEGIGIIEAAHRLAREYAAGRKSMGKAIAQHEMIADYLDEMECDLLALRALAVTSAYVEETSQKLGILQRFESKLSAEEKQRIEKELPRVRARSRRFTPLLKYITAEKAVEHARRCVQIHGGVGYTKEYGAEKLLRDAMVLPIYEGTSQIQSLMAMKDTLNGIVKDPAGFAKKSAQCALRARTANDPLERRVAKVQSLCRGAERSLVARTAMDKLGDVRRLPIGQWKGALTKNWDPKRDFAIAMLHAERLTKLLVDEAICEVLWEQSQKDPARRALLERYLDRCELRDELLFKEITTTGAKMLAKIAEQSGEADATHGQAAE
ncbi:MAG: acyl-CoA dehydrogenase family protein [Polyangiales bacterium]